MADANLRKLVSRSYVNEPRVDFIFDVVPGVVHNSDVKKNQEKIIIRSSEHLQ